MKVAKPCEMGMCNVNVREHVDRQAAKVCQVNYELNYLDIPVSSNNEVNELFASAEVKLLSSFFWTLHYVSIFLPECTVATLTTVAEGMSRGNGADYIDWLSSFLSPWSLMWQLSTVQFTRKFAHAQSEHAADHKLSWLKIELKKKIMSLFSNL